MDNLVKKREVEKYIESKNEDLKQELAYHYKCCEEENERVKLNALHYKREHCDQSSYAESSARKLSPLDFVLEKQQTKMPDIAD